MTRTRRPRAALIAVTAASLCLTIAACGDEDPSDDQPGATSTSTSADEPTVGSFALGETARVDVQDSEAVIDLTVDSITEGSTSELEEVGLEGTPVYVRMTATIVSGNASSFRPELTVDALAGTDEVGGLSSPARVGPCSWDLYRFDAAPGDTIEPCLTFVVEPGGAPVDRVVYEFNGVAGTVAEWR